MLTGFLRLAATGTETQIIALGASDGLKWWLEIPKLPSLRKEAQARKT